MYSIENFEEAFYINALERYVETGEIMEMQASDVLYDYLVSVMRDPWLRANVMGSPVCARLFLDNMMRFVDASLHRKRFDISRKQAEQKGMKETLEWSLQQKEDGWQALLDKLDESYAGYGFRSTFYRKQFESKDNLANDDLWVSLYQDYQISFSECLRQNQQQDINQKDDNTRRRLTNQMQNVPDYLASHAVPVDDFMQTWGLMGGEWNEYDFERLLRIARLQREYPVLTTIAQRMGRMLDPDGKTSVYAGFGSSSKMEHSSKSDIQGVSVGNDISSLLPLEKVQMTDNEFHELFLYKYATHGLQTFQHRSDILRPSRHLERKRANQCGPMIVAIDTSGSMQGKPQNIARSLLMRLIEICRSKKRDLFLIAFAVSARPIDVRRDHVKLLDFFAHESSGDTNATKMMEQTFCLLETSPTYMAADVLLISDFHLPFIPAPMLDNLLCHRTLGTSFYGLQIGDCNTNRWLPHLDVVYKIR